MLKNSLFWEVSYRGRKSYLYGTVHIQDERAFFLAEQVKSFVDACASFAGELNLSQEPSALVASTQAGVSWSYVRSLSASQYRRLTGILKKAFHVDLRYVDHIPPFQLLQMLQLSLLSKDRTMHLDQYLWDYAEGQEKEMHGLESWEQQMHIMQQMVSDSTISELMSYLRNISKIRKEIQHLLALYCEQDIVGLYKKSRKGLGKHRRVMIRERNLIMRDALLSIIETKSCFAAIGAGHLAGKYGLLRMLKLQGCQIKAICFQ